MKRLTYIAVIAVSLFLTACGTSGPSEKDIDGAIVAWYSNLGAYGSNKFLEPVGLKEGDVFTPEIEVINTVKTGDAIYTVQAKYNFKYNKNSTEYTEDQLTAIRGPYSWMKFNKGDRVFNQNRERKFVVGKGSNGWSVINN
jgi:hypothetical protein